MKTIVAVWLSLFAAGLWAQEVVPKIRAGARLMGRLVDVKASGPSISARDGD